MTSGIIAPLNSEAFFSYFLLAFLLGVLTLIFTLGVGGAGLNTPPSSFNWAPKACYPALFYNPLD